MMAPLDPLEQVIRDAVVALGFELVDVRATGPRQRRSVRVRIDRPDSRPGYGVTSDDCTRVARALRSEFAAAGQDTAVDSLEVSSPGIERPVRWPEHWRRFVGRRVKVRSPLLTGRPVGEIVGVPDDEHVTLRVSGEERIFSLADITEATLVADPKGPDHPARMR